MKIRAKHVLVAAALLMTASAAYRSCRAPAPRVAAVGPGGGPRTAVPAVSSEGRFSVFFEGIFGGTGGGEVRDEDAVETDGQARMKSEMNELAEKLEEAEKLPDSVWYPNSAEKEEVEKHASALRELFMLGSMVRGGTATREHMDRYLELRMGIIREKMEMIRRSREKAGDIGDSEGSDAMLRRLEGEIAGMREERRRP